MNRNNLIGILSFFTIFSLFFETQGALGESKPLNREMALSLIRETREFSKITSQILLHRDGFQKGYEQGFWLGGIIEPNESVLSTPPEVKLTSKGSQFFDKIDMNPNGPNYVTLKKPLFPPTEIKNLIEVNGGKPELKVEFTWGYDTIPSTVKRFIVEGGSGFAILSQSPRGWRIKTIHLEYSNKPAVVPPEEIKSEERDKTEQDQLKKKREEEKQAKRKKFWFLLRESKTPSEQIADYQFHFTTLDRATSIQRIYDFTSTVSDVNIKVDGSEITGSTQLNYRYIFWYNDIQEISKGFDSDTNLHWIKIKSKYGKRVLWGSEEKDFIEEVYQTLKTAQARWVEKYKEIAGQIPP